MEKTSATRMDLLLKREELNSASTGAGLLRNKRDVLLREFFSILRILIVQREMLDSQASQASRSLFFALGLEGKEKLTSFSFMRPRSPILQVDYRNLLGLKIPEIGFGPQEDEKADYLGWLDTGLSIVETKERFQDFLKLALRILPQELKLKRLGREIKNTTRKVNSLEKFIIPRLHSQIRFIRQTLEEREREDIFRLKRLKKHLTERGTFATK